MSYLSRIPILGLKHDYFKSFYSVCPCKKIAECSSKLYFVRSQSTIPTTSVRLIRRMRPKKNVCKKQYTDVIKAGNADGQTTSQEIKIVKKTSVKNILKEMDTMINEAKKGQKQNQSSSTHLPQSASGLKFNNNSDKKQLNKCQQRRLTTTVNSSAKGATISLESAEDSKVTSQNVFINQQPMSSSQFQNYDETQAVSALDEIAEFQDEITEASKLNVKSERLSTINKEKTHKKQLKEMRRNALAIYCNMTLAAYIDVCINCNMVNQGYNVLLAFRARGKSKQNAQTLPVYIFNLLVTAYARRGNWSRVKELLFILREDKIKPDLQTYAGLIYCAGKLPNPHADIISNLLKDCEKDGFDIRNLDNSCVFIDDQRERVINTILKVKPDFSPLPITNMEPYNNKLLTSLREPIDRYQSLGVGSGYTEKYLKSNVSHQMQTEVDGYINIKSIQKLSSEIGPRTIKMRKLLQRCETNWELSLTNRFKSSLKTLAKEMNRGVNTKNVNLFPFVSVLKVEEYVKIMVKEIRDLAENSETYSLPITTLHQNLGRKVMNRYFVKTKEKNNIVDKIIRVYRKYSHYQLSSHLMALENPREHWTKHLQILSKGPSINIQEVIWPGNILSAVGKFIYDILLQEVTFDTSLIRYSDKSAISTGKVPAFYNIYRNQKVNLIEEVKPHPFLVRLFNMVAKETITFETNIIPMLVPPLPWTSTKCGGYLLSSVPLVRLTSYAQLQRTRLSDAPVKQLWPIFDSLNQLSECAWKINQPILDLLIHVFNNDGDESLDIPPPPTPLPVPVLHTGMSKEEKAKVYKDRIWLKRRRAEMYSLWCDALYRLSIANEFRDKPFWFPHNLDFRGRVYPCPPHFNHLGGDVARSLLLFDKAEPLGEKGLDWLKIHVINLTGLKKRDSLEERLKYANDMMPEIIDSAFNPLTGNRWWAKSEEPWQTLACCKEIVKASAAPDPTKYLCHFPIHQDGSCNGLQHYSALGRDVLGAHQVNLHPSDRPQDVYAGIAQLVEAERVKDAAAGIEIAKYLEGFVQRKVIKQTVMTTVYGVTRYGARLQILKQLKAMPNFPMDKHWGASLYLVEKTFQSLQKMFTATKEIQDWLTESARLVSHVCGQTIEWVTPLGLPVVQPYHRDSRQTFTIGSNNRISVPSIDVYERPNVTKQKNAFPPNYIHSLDSTHMMLTSLHCRRKGIMFVSVHDCFWTHPPTVEIMNQICREQFVALHNLTLLNELSEFFTEKYSYRENELLNDGSVEDATIKKLNRLLQRVPKTGQFQLNNVLNSTYFFS